jgi:hypothetical protein
LVNLIIVDCFVHCCSSLDTIRLLLFLFDFFNGFDLRLENLDLVFDSLHSQLVQVYFVAEILQLLQMSLDRVYGLHLLDLARHFGQVRLNLFQLGQDSLILSQVLGDLCLELLGLLLELLQCDTVILVNLGVELF